MPTLNEVDPICQGLIDYAHLQGRFFDLLQETTLWVETAGGYLQSMEQRISLITLAVSDMGRAATFYEALGWTQVETQDGIVAFDLISQTLGLYPKEALAQELGFSVDALGSGAMLLSHNVRTKDEVTLILDKAASAGGHILNPAKDVFWGGHHGHFQDPDGHIWEIAHNPFSTLGADGSFQWNGADA